MDGLQATGGGVPSEQDATGGVMPSGGAMLSGDMGVTGGTMPSGGAMSDNGMPGMEGAMTEAGACCPDGNCLCRGPDPTELTSERGPYTAESYNLSGVGCVYYPVDAEPPFAAVSIADGLGGSGGCNSFQTGQWGPFYASHGIVAMIVSTGSGDFPAQRGDALLEGIEGFKAENENSSSPLFGKLAGRYGTSGFSMGGGGTTYAAREDSSLLSSVGLMAWQPVGGGVTVPTLFICGSSDPLAPCPSHGANAYNDMPETTPKMWVEFSVGHVGQPSAAGGSSGAYALAFQKVFLEGDERWRPILLAADIGATTIQ